MRINHQKVIALGEKLGISVTDALERAGVSRTAYYSLTRRASVLPRTVRALAATLGVAPQELLDAPAQLPAHETRLLAAREICARKPGLDFHNVWHTLTLLEKSPLERLEGSLRRGRGQVD